MGIGYMAEEDEGAIGAVIGLWGLRGLRGLWGLRELWGLRRIGGCYIFNVRWLGHHGNRLYGFMGLRSKLSGDGWVMDGWIPLRLLRLLEHLRC